MGFETRTSTKGDDMGYIMRHPYGIWNKHSPRKASKTSDYETSLWDLKLRLGVAIDFPDTLWDIPMGFETPVNSKCVLFLFIMRHPYGIWNICFTVSKVWFLNYETSLWDLKPGDLVDKGNFSYIMRHPYGIWNSCISLWISDSFNYETSLWDLKLMLFR